MKQQANANCQMAAATAILSFWEIQRHRIRLNISFHNYLAFYLARIHVYIYHNNSFIILLAFYRARIHF
jgi:hypothetical protein